MDTDRGMGGRGKPMAAMSHGNAPGFPGKRRRLGMVGRPPGSVSGSGGASGAGRGLDFSGSSLSSGLKPGVMPGRTSHGQPATTIAAAIASKKRGEDRKKGRVPTGVAKFRGIVGLQVR